MQRLRSAPRPQRHPLPGLHRARWLFALAGLITLGCGDDATGAADVGVDGAADVVLATDSAANDAAADTGGLGPDSNVTVDTLPMDTSNSETSTGPTPLGIGVFLGEIDSQFFNAAFAGARLLRVAPPDDTSGEVFGPCRVTEVDPDASEPARFGLDAGEISVSGTSPAVTLAPVDEGAFGTGYASSLSTDQVDLLPGGGAIVMVSGAGGADVEAFSGVIQMPEPVVIGTPATGISADANVTQGLLVSWNAGTGTSVLVSLTPVSGAGAAIAGPGAFCLLTADAGQVVVPSDALRALIPSGSSQLVALGVTRTRVGAASNVAHIVPLTATRSSGGPLTLRVP